VHPFILFLLLLHELSDHHNKQDKNMTENTLSLLYTYVNVSTITVYI